MNGGIQVTPDTQAQLRLFPKKDLKTPTNDRFISLSDTWHKICTVCLKKGIENHIEPELQEE